MYPARRLYIENRWCNRVAGGAAVDSEERRFHPENQPIRIARIAGAFLGRIADLLLLCAHRNTVSQGNGDRLYRANPGKRARRMVIERVVTAGPLAGAWPRTGGYAAGIAPRQDTARLRHRNDDRFDTAFFSEPAVY